MAELPIGGPIDSPRRGRNVAEDDNRRQVQDFLELSRHRWLTSSQASHTNRELMRYDQKFRSGGKHQWDGIDASTRETEGRPCLTVNRIPQFIRQVSNQARSNRSQLQVNPRGKGATVETAAAIQGLMRSVEIDSDAEIAYDTATDHQLTIGIGFCRLKAEYDAQDGFTQVCRIKRIRNPLSVYWDPSGQEYEGEDWRYLHIVGVMGKDEYEARWGQYSSYQSLTEYMKTESSSSAKDWMPEGKVVVVEYFYVTIEEKTLLQLEDGTTLFEGPQLAKFAQAWDDAYQGQYPLPQIVKTRTVPTKVVRWCLHNAVAILEGNKDRTAGKVIPGTRIPIYPCIGDEQDLDGTVDYRGMVRDAIGPAQMYNFWLIALDTPIPTPTGWTTQGEIQVGDRVFDPSGAVCDVIGKSPVHTGRRCLKVTFDDGSSIVAEENHPWAVEERGKRRNPTWEWTEKTIPTKELTPKKHFIWATKPLDLPASDLPIHPYLLGVWLGDGHSSVPTITQSVQDGPDLRDQLAAVGSRLGANHATDRPDVITFTVLGQSATFRDWDLFNNKHIPQMYLRASREQRLALLQGLMDTDGSVSVKLRVCEFTTTIPRLRDGFAELIRSLGIRAKCCTRAGRQAIVHGKPSGGVGQTFYQFSFTAPTVKVFRLPRKAVVAERDWKRHPRRTDRHGIVSVVEVPSVPVQCIGVSSESHLYLAGLGMVATHNTSSIAETVALAPKSPWVAAAGQIEEYLDEWKEANIKPFSVLRYDPKTVDGQIVPPPERSVANPPIEALVMGLKEADQDIKAVMGLFEASLGEKGPQQSGKAITAVQQQGVQANSNFLDNRERMKRAIGRSLLEWMPVIYDEARIEHLVAPDGKRYQAMIHSGEQFAPNPDDMPPDVTKVFDIGVGKYELTVSTGPSWQTEKQETEAWLLELFKVLPGLAAIGADIVLENSDNPAAKQLAARAKIMLPPALQDKNDPATAMPQLQAQNAQLTELLQKAHAAITSMSQEIQNRLQGKLIDAHAKILAAIIAEKGNIDAAAIKAGMEGHGTVFEAERARMSQVFDHLSAMALQDSAHDDTLEEGAQGHDQALEQNAQQAALAPQPDEGGQGGGGQ